MIFFFLKENQVIQSYSEDDFLLSRNESQRDYNNLLYDIHAHVDRDTDLKLLAITSATLTVLRNVDAERINVNLARPR